jgi:hypothetical protein
VSAGSRLALREYTGIGWRAVASRADAAGPCRRSEEEAMYQAIVITKPSADLLATGRVDQG